MPRRLCVLICSVLTLASVTGVVVPSHKKGTDYLRDLQTAAIASGKSDVGHWGPKPDNYTAWSSHTNRLIPVYTFGTRGGGSGIDVTNYTGSHSPYRSESELKRIYGRMPTNTLNPDAEYMDQTNIADIQRAALASGRKYIFLVIFDGMDWQTTLAAAIYNAGRVQYTEGRGSGTHFQNYTADGTTQFAFMCTSPHNDKTDNDVDQQTVKNPGGKLPGGYNVSKGGPTPWTPGNDGPYVIAQSEFGKQNSGEHAYTDSSSAATSMTAGIKTYNNAINVGPSGEPVATVAHDAQALGYGVGVVSSVPISHATPACAYAHNVDRDDYQDLTRDLVGLPSVAHPERPLPGVDVLIGGGWGVVKKEDKGQGKNFVPGNQWITDEDLKRIDVNARGPFARYVMAQRTPSQRGGAVLQAAADLAAKEGHRLFGFFGVANANGHLPFQTADGDYQPAYGRKLTAEKYTPADIKENPTLAEMTTAALTTLSHLPQGRSKGFWIMVESGDVDWANHDNNLDNSIGAVNSGDAAVKVITDWVEKHSSWKESLLIVTADHGHYLVLDKPEMLAGEGSGNAASIDATR